MDWLGKTCVVGRHWVPRVRPLPLRGVRAYLRYLVAVANVGQFSLRVSLPDLTCLPLGVSHVYSIHLARYEQIYYI